MSLAIDCRGLHKRYEHRTKPVDAVNGLDLQVRVGECFGLLGPNGAGKTTAIEILEGLLAPTSGHVEVLGTQWHRGCDRELRNKIGISLQETKLADKLTVRETVTLFRSLYQTGTEPDALIAQVSLTDKVGAWVEKLSGGQRQRLAVACALVGDPELLFLDEPTTGLDPQSRRRIWDIVYHHRERGKTTLITTHYMDEAERLCDRVAVVDYGKVIALGTPAELIARLGGDHVIEFSLIDSNSHRPVADPGSFENLPEVQSSRLDAGTFSLSVAKPHVALPALLDHLQRHDLKLTHLTTRHASLEDVFVNLTGRHLRDEDLPPA